MICLPEHLHPLILDNVKIDPEIRVSEVSEISQPGMLDDLLRQ